MRLVGVLAVLSLGTGVAHADGEYGPMFGGALIATHAPYETDVGGVQMDVALWRGRLGLAVEASHQADLEGIGPSVTKVGGSLRLLLYRQMTPALLTPNEDVEAGIELHALIVEHAWWWDDGREREPWSYGTGLALRLRGGTDFANILAESRVFLRVLATPAMREEASFARMVAPGSDRDLSIVIGLGAVFGGGNPPYARRFKEPL